MKTFVIALLLLVSLCFAQTGTWFECDAITNSHKDLSKRSLLIHDDMEANRIMKETALGLEENSLKVKEEDSEFDKNLKKIVTGDYIMMGVNNNRNKIQSYNVPNGMKTQCIKRQVPYYYTNVGRTRGFSSDIIHFAKKYGYDTSKTRKGAIFLIQGGPGAGGEALEPLGLQLWDKFNGKYDIVIPDHRGTARSYPQTCTGSTYYQFVTCQSKVSGNMNGYTTDDAAMDTITLMQDMKKVGGEVLLYGVSYGTFVSERIINLCTSQYPNLLSAIILDGICGTGACDFTKADQGQEKTAMSFFDYCTKDDFCRGKLGSTRTEILNKLDQVYSTKNTCTTMFSVTLKALFQQALMDPVLRLLIPAIMHRAERCSMSDIYAIPNMINNFMSAQQEDNEGAVGYPTSMPINLNIGISELRGRYGNTAQAESFARTCKMCSGASSLYPKVRDAGWKLYPESIYEGAPASNLPILLLNGDLDPQTSIDGAETYYDKLKITSSNSLFVKFPGVVHYVLGRSPLKDDVNQNCGFNIAADFFKNKNVKNLDTSCTTKLLGVPFAGYSYTYDRVATDMYDGFGLNKKQRTIFIVVVVLVSLGILLFCACCITCCCWLGRCGPFKPKPIVLEERTTLINSQYSHNPVVYTQPQPTYFNQ